MTESESKAQAIQEFGPAGGIQKRYYFDVTLNKWKVLYEIGLQLQPATIQTPFGVEPNPLAGQIMSSMDVKGSGSSWLKAWESYRS